jgi:16S rRNA (guanine527-N7)-methyltransferase
MKREVARASSRPAQRKFDLAQSGNDRAYALELMQVSPAVEERLNIYAALLTKWQKTINLVANSTLPDIWVRHFADSAQVLDAVPEARRWVDLGSGAGFPGLVTAIRLADTPGARVHLIESDQRKCAFLREVSRETGAPVIIHAGRIEQIVPIIEEKIEAVSARALASLPILLDWSKKFLEKEAVGVFLKGQNLDAELTDSSVTSTYLVSMLQSRTLASAQIVIVKAKTSELSERDAEAPEGH